MPQIYATLGPSCESKEILISMLHEGLNGMRLNLSHASIAESRKLIEMYADSCRCLSLPFELMIDLHGPEQRTGSMKNISLSQNSSVILRPESLFMQDSSIPVSSEFLAALETNDHVLISDGIIELQIEQKLPPVPHIVKGSSKEFSSFSCRVLRGGIAASNQSIKIIGKEVLGPLLTEKDFINLDMAAEMGVTSVMQPFVQCGQDIVSLRSALESRKLHVKIFAKIESLSGVQNLASIIDTADVVVIARGDLGNAVPLWELPAIQKQIASQCRSSGKPFMVVTQMLHSMLHAPVPTRAEVLDIFNAVLDGASYLMVTGETTVGEYPAQVIHYLKRTAFEAEKYIKNYGVF